MTDHKKQKVNVDLLAKAMQRAFHEPIVTVEGNMDSKPDSMKDEITRQIETVDQSYTKENEIGLGK